MLIYKRTKTIDGKRTVLFGIPIMSEKKYPDKTKKVYLFGIFKKIKMPYVSYFYMFGIRVNTKVHHQHLISFLHSLQASSVAENKKNIIMANSVTQLHLQTFPSFKNCNLNQNIVVVGCGPTLNNYSYMNKAKHIALNRAICCDRIKFDYSFWVDYRNDTDKWLEQFSKYDCIKFYGKHMNFIPPINERGCAHIPDYVAIRDNALRFYSNAFDPHIYQDISCAPLVDLGSVAHCAVHFALYTHPKKIYLVGCDCSNNGYFNNRPQPIWSPDKVIDGYMHIKNFAQVYYPDIEIISVNPVGLRGLFKDVYTESFLQQHPEIDRNSIEIINEKGEII